MYKLHNILSLLILTWSDEAQITCYGYVIKWLFCLFFVVVFSNVDHNLCDVTGGKVVECKYQHGPASLQ